MIGRGIVFARRHKGLPYPKEKFCCWRRERGAGEEEKQGNEHGYDQSTLDACMKMSQ
jgi:hypothetical protein